jgi:hypothetical protein
MGNYSNAKEIRNNPNYVVCNARQLQHFLLKHRKNASIISILKKAPVCINYCYNPVSRVAEPDTFVEYFYTGSHLLWFHIGSLRFTDNCQIVVTKKLHKEIQDLKKLNVKPLSKDDKIQLLQWTVGHNHFLA